MRCLCGFISNIIRKIEENAWRVLETHSDGQMIVISGNAMRQVERMLADKSCLGLPPVQWLPLRSYQMSQQVLAQRRQPVVQNLICHEKSPAANISILQRGLFFPWCPGSDLNRHNPKVEGF